MLVRDPAAETCERHVEADLDGARLGRPERPEILLVEDRAQIVEHLEMEPDSGSQLAHRAAPVPGRAEADPRGIAAPDAPPAAFVDAEPGETVERRRRPRVGGREEPVLRRELDLDVRHGLAVRVADLDREIVGRLEDDRQGRWERIGQGHKSRPESATRDHELGSGARTFHVSAPVRVGGLRHLRLRALDCATFRIAHLEEEAVVRREQEVAEIDVLARFGEVELRLEAGQRSRESVRRDQEPPVAHDQVLRRLAREDLEATVGLRAPAPRAAPDPDLDGSARHGCLYVGLEHASLHARLTLELEQEIVGGTVEVEETLLVSPRRASRPQVTLGSAQAQALSRRETQEPEASLGVGGAVRDVPSEEARGVARVHVLIGRASGEDEQPQRALRWLASTTTRPARARAKRREHGRLLARDEVDLGAEQEHPCARSRPSADRRWRELDPAFLVRQSRVPALLVARRREHHVQLAFGRPSLEDVETRPWVGQGQARRLRRVRRAGASGEASRGTCLLRGRS